MILLSQYGTKEQIAQHQEEVEPSFQQLTQVRFPVIFLSCPAPVQAEAVAEEAKLRMQAHPAAWAVHDSLVKTVGSAANASEADKVCGFLPPKKQSDSARNRMASTGKRDM